MHDDLQNLLDLILDGATNGICHCKDGEGMDLNPQLIELEDI